MSNQDRTYSDLLEAAGDDVEDYVVINHGRGRGEGTAVINPDKGGYSDDSVKTVSGLTVEVAEDVRAFYQGVHMYDVEGAGDRTAGEALEEVIHDLSDMDSRNSLSASDRKVLES